MQIMKNSSEAPRSHQTIRVDDGPKIILVDKGRIIDEIRLGDFDTRTIKTHQGQIMSCVMEAVTYYRGKSTAERQQ
jgi:hypothetical protein